MIRKVFDLACGLLVALALLALPSAALAGPPAVENTLPGDIYAPNGTTKIQTAPFAIITKDSDTGNWCIVGSTETCVLPGTGASASEDAATETTLQDVLDEIADLRGDLAAPATSLPVTAPASKGDATYITTYADISGAATTALATATSSQTSRLHWLYCTVDGAGTGILKDGSTQKSPTFKLPTSGGILELEFRDYPYLETTANTALNFVTTGSAAWACMYTYKKD